MDEATADAGRISPSSYGRSGTKRKHDELYDCDDPKRYKPSDINLLDLPDCVLLEVFRYFRSLELIQLSKTCTRFEYLVEEKKLWNVVNLDGCFTVTDAQFAINRVTRRTRKISFKPQEQFLFRLPWLLQVNKFHSIKVIVLENQSLTDGSCVLLNFPPSLEVLSLKYCHMSLEAGKYFFSHGEDKVTKLHTLLLDFCPWVQESSLMVISKLPELRNLSMLGCQLVRDALSYTGLAGRYGFKKLQRLNVSFTGLADEFIKSFYCLPSLQELYMRNETNNHIIPVTDQSLRWYRHSVSNDTVPGLLYNEYFRSPYGDCECSYGDPNDVETYRNDKATYNKHNQDERDANDEKKIPFRSYGTEGGPGTSVTRYCRHGTQIDIVDYDSHCQVVVDLSIRSHHVPMRRRIPVPQELNNMVIIGNPIKKKISLRVLTLRNFHKVTDDSLQSLSHLPLTLLDVTGTNVTDDGVRNYLNLHPNCRVVHKSACHCGPLPL